MTSDRSRALEIEGTPLGASAVVLGTACQDSATPVDTDVRAPLASAVVWEGTIASAQTAQKSYFVRLYADGSAFCQCPAFYFRATIKRDPRYFCKHIKRARTRCTTQQ
jgi:hypothetical protein